MRRGTVIVAVTAVAVLLTVATAGGELIQEGNLRVSFDGSFAPKSLPRDRPAPITVAVEGAVATTDGSRPPVLQEVEIGISRNGLISTRGLPTCTTSRLQSTTTEQALERCRDARVGSGSFEARIDFPGAQPVPAHGKVLAFNGEAGGKPALLLQLYSESPVRIAFVVPLKIESRPKEKFGTVLSTRLPTLAAGSATVTQIKLKLGRTYSYRGERRGFISASCSAPTGFTAGIFAFARGNFRFSDGKTVRVALTRDCRVR
ncbi:MAG TPA: hypothetical protein VGO66_01290 [Solirubrobacterales bacterium]|jgi:hypothetical protein|nr:hypothetical protein [Solirubrobacterales bacterium]